MPFFALASCLATFSPWAFTKVQPNILSLFGFFFFFFCFPFSPILVILLQLLTLYWVCLQFKNFWGSIVKGWRGSSELITLCVICKRQYNPSVLRGMPNCLMASVNEHCFPTIISRTAWYLWWIPCKLDPVINSEIQWEKFSISIDRYLLFKKRAVILWGLSSYNSTTKK